MRVSGARANARRVGAGVRAKRGAEQLSELAKAFEQSVDGWLILPNPTLMAEVKTPDVRPYLSDAALAELEARCMRRGARTRWY